MKAYSYKILCFGPNRHDSDEASLRESMELDVSAFQNV